jgi:hypothetical protein
MTIMPSVCPYQKPLTLSYQSINWVDVSGTSWNFGSLGIGTASSDRYVLCVVAAGDNSDTTSGTSTDLTVTIDGNSMTRIREQRYGDRYVGLFGYAMPTGTTATFAVSTASSAKPRCGLGIYTAVGLKSLTARDEASQFNISNAGPYSLDVDVLAGGAVITAAFHYTASTNRFFTWVGATEAFDDNSAQTNTTLSSAAYSPATAAETPRTVSVDMTASSSGAQAFAVALR